MAKVIVRIPEILKGDNFARAVELSVIEGLTVAGAEIHRNSARRAPANTGALRQQLRWLVRKTRGDMSGRLVAAGPARQYADVMDKGRRPEARGPHSRHLRRWVQLKLRDAVSAMALSIAQKARPPGSKGASKKTPEQRALDGLSYLVARKIHREGIKPRNYVTDERVAAKLVTREIGRAFRARVSAASRMGFSA